MTFYSRCAAALAIGLGFATPLAAQAPLLKIDEALTQSLRAGCTTEAVIVRTRRGYTAGMAASLLQHGDSVTAEHASIDAVSAEVHCADLKTMASFSSVLSISKDAIVRADGAPAARAKKGQGRTHAAVRVAKPAPKPLVKTQGPKRQSSRELRALLAKAAAAALKDVRLREGKNAEDLQEALYESLGVTPARDRAKGTVLLGDVTHNGDNDTFNDLGGWEKGRSARSIGVAIIDSGLDPSVDFGDRITAFYDFTRRKPSRTRPSDEYGHGTHIAGLVASRFVGIAPDVRLIGLKVLDRKGQGKTSDVVRAIEFAVANRRALGIRVLNLSLGHPVFEPAATDPLVQAVEHAVRAGLVVVASAGNFGTNPVTGLPGYTGIVSPGNAPSALTVGALQTFDTVSRADDRVTAYSSRGPSWYDAFAKPDLVAPGHNMLSLAAPKSYLRKLNEARGGSGAYMRLSGTSMSAAVASGVVALVLEENPALTPNALKMVLEFTAIPVKDAKGTPYDALTQGAGGINGAGAIDLAGVIDTSRPVGHKWLTSGLDFQSVIGGHTLAWSQLMIWGAHRVIGDGVIDENRPAWAANIVWGDATDDDNIVWGTISDGDDDNIVWGTLFDLGDNIVWGTNFVWGTALDDSDNIVWGTFFYDDDNIVWGTNIVWGNHLIGLAIDDDNIVWGTLFDLGDNIVWGTLSSDNIVWGNLFDADNIVWGTAPGDDDNIVWGTAPGDDDNIVWGTAIIWGESLVIGRRPDVGRERRARRER